MEAGADMMFGIPGYTVISYAYDEGQHCIRCARKRFGSDKNGYVPTGAKGTTGSPVTATYSTDTFAVGAMPCTTCARLICTTCGLTDAKRKAGETCWNCRAEWRDE
jgi:hypothetical protein